MTSKALTEILTKHGGAQTKGNRAEVPLSAELTLFASMPDESLVIERVRQVELEPEYLVAHTARGERFVVLYEDVRAARFASKASAAATGYAS